MIFINNLKDIKMDNVLDNFSLEIENEKGDITPIKIKFRKPSCAVKDSLMQIDELMAERLSTEQLEIEKLIKDYEDKNPGKVADKSAEMLPSSVKFQNNIDRITNKFTIDKLKSMINTKQLTTEYHALINKDSSDDFWKEQSMPKIKEAVDFFTKSYKQITTV